MTPAIETERLKVYCADALSALQAMPSASVDCVVTSPPYWGLRDYQCDGQIGLEPSLAEFIDTLVAVFGECHRVMKKTGTLWVNMGDGYFGDSPVRKKSTDASSEAWDPSQTRSNGGNRRSAAAQGSLRPKSLIGQPWRLALALQDAGWLLRSDIIWSKTNAMPESVKDRPTRSHEYIFLFAKARRYYYDADALRTPYAEATHKRLSQETLLTQAGGAKDYGPESNRSVRRVLENMHDRKPHGWASSEGYAGQTPGHPPRLPDTYKGSVPGRSGGPGQDRRQVEAMREATAAEGANARTVWTFPTTAYRGGHYATFPIELPRRCIAAGCPPGGVVLDPFAGTGTTLAAALEAGCHAIGVELNPAYVELLRARIEKITPALL